MAITTEVSICNKAMLLLGASYISSLSPPSPQPNGGRLAIAYPIALDAELRKRQWIFAKSWDNYPRDPSWSGTRPRTYRFRINPQVVRTIITKGSDWVVQGRYVYTDDSAATLDVEVVRNDIAPADFDPLFVDVLAARLAFDTAEAVTQSNSKKAEAKEAYKDAVRDASKANGFETPPRYAPDGTWSLAVGG